MSNMQKNYHPETLEKKWYQHWEEAEYFKSGRATGKTYSMMLPPPNVTGTLHMGHGFQHTLMDVLTRCHRMMGEDVLWQPGTDHAGIATQMVVERQLNAEGKSRHDLGREAFVERIWQWKAYAGDNISKQMRRLGVMPDWSRERFTMDEGLSDAVKEAFTKLYQDGLIYRGERLVNWDPVLLTAVSDLEVVQEEEEGFLWQIRYPLADESGFVEIATTRPETMLGDVAVAVHPEDERYASLVGRKLQLPLSDREIPVIADEYVERDFGTGCVKITPAHDFNDYEIGKRHGLLMINILTEKADLNEQVPEKYRGLDRFAARKAVLADLEDSGLLVRTKKHKLKVPKGDRSGAILEPYLTKQWFVKADILAEKALEVVENGTVKFIPDNWKNTYYAWMRDLNDWCISRQLWWGHRIPAWYDDSGNVYVGQSEAQVRLKYQLKSNVSLKQDEDVFDTWFSAALWPFSTLGWPEKTPVLEKYYPTSVLITGFDIIFFWVARMMMFGLYFIQDVPFKEIYITGLIRDGEGRKMSKSKGNVLDPVDLIEGISLEKLIEKRTSSLMQPKMKARIEKQTRKHFPEGIAAFGADALRFTFTALASTSRDVNFDISRMEGYRNFCNKLWNASRFVMMNLEGFDQSNENRVFGVSEKWIWHRLNHTVAEVHQHIAQYRFDLLAKVIYTFVWHDYCDWYLELAKAKLSRQALTLQERQGVQYTLVTVLEEILKLAHPLIPFITEEIFHEIKPYTGNKTASLMIARYPVFDKKLENADSAKHILWLQKVIVAVRTVRAEMNIKPALKIPLYFKNASTLDLKRIEQAMPFIQSMAKVAAVHVKEVPPVSATQIVDGLEIHIPLAGVIDAQSECFRLEKSQRKLENEIKRIEQKLANCQFVDNAPIAVVEKEKVKLQAYRETFQKQAVQLEKLKPLKACE